MSPGLTRRQVMQGLGATVGAVGALGVHNRASASQTRSAMEPYAANRVPDGVRSRFLRDINGLTMHVLEAGWQNRPGLLLLHGFPELAYSWRHVMVPLAEAGYHVIAPDQRGYGRTTGWDPDYDGDLASYRRLNIVRDALGLVSAFGYRSPGGGDRTRFRFAYRRLVCGGPTRHLSGRCPDERALRRHARASF